MVLYYLLGTGMEFVLLYFPVDKTFDIKPVTATNIGDSHVAELREHPQQLVRLNTEYDGLSCCGIVIQISETESSLKPFLDECVFLKTKQYSIERILALPYITRFNQGGRPKLPNRQVSFYWLT